MRWPWQRITRTDEERMRADREVAFARSHLRVLIGELDRLTARMNAKAEALSHDR